MARKLNIIKTLCLALLAVSLLGIGLNLGYAQGEKIRPVEIGGKVYLLDISSIPLKPRNVLVIEAESGKIFMLIGSQELLDTYNDLQDKEITVVGRMIEPPIWRYKGEFLPTIEVKEYFIHSKEEAQESETK